ncbi:MAG: flagellar motor protein MotB [Phycisphaerae bacterium]
MAKRRAQSKEEEASTTGDWLVTFSDCMTLLLCFFVMLLSFSSFERKSLAPLEGIWDRQKFPTILPTEQEPLDSPVEEVPHMVDHTRYGSEMPTDEELKAIDRPEVLPEIVSMDAYKDRRVLTIPSEQMFYGKGHALTREGREALQMVAKFLKLLPCKVIVRETDGDHGSQMEADRALRRSWRVREFFVKHSGLPVQMFGLSDSSLQEGGRFGGRRVLQITLLAESAYE